MCSIKCKCSDSGAFAGAHALHNETMQCAGCSVLPAKDENLAVEKGRVKLKFYLKKYLFKNQ